MKETFTLVEVAPATAEMVAWRMTGEPVAASSDRQFLPPALARCSWCSRRS